jgi:Cu2+-exporting ATPase
VLVRRLQALETLATVDTVVFDKTGTLTRDAFALARVTTRGGVSQADALAWAGALARQSLHPVSRALVAAGGQAATAPMHAEAVQEVAGQGLHGRVVMGGASGSGGQTFRLGSATFCGLVRPAADALEVCLADEDGWVATFELREDLRADARSTVRWMVEHGIAVRLLSGDGATAVARVADAVGIKAARGACSPQDKLAFLREAQGQGRKVVMVGDGLNDGPGLAGAHVSFAFGTAVPLAQSQSDFVVMGDQLAAVAQTVQLARRTMRIVRQNLWWAAGYNAVCVPLAVLGWLPAWLAGLGMALSSLGVVMNALRLAGRIETMETT